MAGRRARAALLALESCVNGEPAMLTVPEVARLLRIGRNLAYELVARGEIPSRRLGRKILIPRAELEERFALRRSVPPTLTDAAPDARDTRHN